MFETKGASGEDDASSFAWQECLIPGLYSAPTAITFNA
jgi:hypothetical protein